VGQFIRKVFFASLVSLTVAIPASGKSADIDAQALFMTAQLESDHSSATVIIQEYLQPAFAQAQQDANLSLAAKIGMMLSAQYRSIGMYRTALEILDAIDPKGCTSDPCIAALGYEFALGYRANGDISRALVSASDALHADSNMQTHEMQATLLNEKTNSYVG
jgi:hypothetical protein